MIILLSLLNIHDRALSLSLSLSLSLYIYIYIYIHTCLCVCFEIKVLKLLHNNISFTIYFYGICDRERI